MLETMQRLDAPGIENAGHRMMLFRQLMALHLEAVDFIERAVRWHGRTVSELLAVTPPASVTYEATTELEKLLGTIDRKSPYYLGDWLVELRNITFHYPTPHPAAVEAGEEPTLRALTDAAALEGRITISERRAGLRYAYADQVVVQWLAEVTQPEVFAKCRQATYALVNFAEAMTGNYLSKMRATITVDADSG